MWWIYNILLDVQIFNSFALTKERNVRLNLTEGPLMYTQSGRFCSLNVIFAIYARYLR